MHPGKYIGQSKGDGMSSTRFAAITTTVIVLSYITAVTVSSLEKVLAYVGSTGSTTISFILPGLFYYKISSPDSPQHQKLMKEDDDEAEEFDENEIQGLLAGAALSSSAWRKGILRKMSLGLVVYGIVVMVTCLITNMVVAAVH
jgi:amino acid permease